MNWYDDIDVWAGMVGCSARETQAELGEWVEMEPGCWVRRIKRWDADSGKKQSKGVSP
jgi:hypothetical protein